jgi:hypothetical protein
MEQLTMTSDELELMGFFKKVYPADELNSEKTVFEIPCVNGCFYYNTGEMKYKWYHKTVIGEFSNHILLSINSKDELYIILGCFKVRVGKFV